MPISVPAKPRPTGPMAPAPAPRVDPLFLALAAGDLHTSGRLFMPAETVPGDVAASNPEGG